ncbi:MAG: hypothetical protein AAFX53_01820 [Bacteroidota bacterium]
MFIRVFGQDSITEIDWATIERGDCLRLFYDPILGRSSKIFVQNSDHITEILQVNDQVYPLTLGKKSKKNACYLFSFPAQYIDYSRAEILKGRQYKKSQRFTARFLFPPLRVLAEPLDLEKVVFVNNFFLATNLYEGNSPLAHSNVLDYLRKRYPDRAIVYRSVNDMTGIDLFQKLKKQGGLPLACRQLYILDPANKKYLKKRPVVQDRKLWEKSQDLFWEQATELPLKEMEVLLKYYRQLYLEKYSPLNPDYTPEFIKASMDSGMLDYYVLRAKANNALVAIQAVTQTKEVLCTPLIGYNQNWPKERGLYRLMNHQLTHFAAAQGKILNMSSGASKFKKQRGGVPCFDHHIVFTDHLPKRRQWIWKKLHWYSEKHIKPKMIDLGV